MSSPGCPGDDVLGVVAQVGVEVQRVRVVQPHLRVRAGGGDEEREVPLVGPGQVQAGLDASRQVVMALGEVLLGCDVRGAGDDLLGLGHRLSERLGQRCVSGCIGCGQADEPEARQVVKRHHRLVGAHVPGVGDPPPAVRAAGVAVLVEGRALNDRAILRRDHEVLEPPGATGGVTVHGDLGLARGMDGDDARSHVGAEERDDLVPAGHRQRLPEGLGPVVHGGVGGEDVPYLVPQLLVDISQIAVLELTDLFERVKVHVTSLDHLLERNKNLF